MITMQSNDVQMGRSTPSLDLSFTQILTPTFLSSKSFTISRLLHSTARCSNVQPSEISSGVCILNKWFLSMPRQNLLYSASSFSCNSFPTLLSKLSSFQILALACFLYDFKQLFLFYYHNPSLSVYLSLLYSFIERLNLSKFYISSKN